MTIELCPSLLRTGKSPERILSCSIYHYDLMSITTRLALGALGLGWLVLVAGLVVDFRRDSPEATIRRYLADLGAERVELALAALTPAARARWHDFIDFQQHNRYNVVSIATRSASLLSSMVQGSPWRATQVTLIVDILEPSGQRWRGSTVVPVEWRDGRWWIERPPFAPE
jgi:hypothetical protein